MCVDVFAAGIGKWYEFRCEEDAVIKNIIKEMYIAIRNIEKNTTSEITELSQAGSVERKENKRDTVEEKERELYKNKLSLVCINSREILDKNSRLKDCAVENGNRLILI